MKPLGAGLELATPDGAADCAELDHLVECRVELVVGAGGNLFCVPGLKVPEQSLCRPEFVSFERTPRTLAIHRNSCVKNRAGLPDVKSGSFGSLPKG